MKSFIITCFTIMLLTSTQVYAAGTEKAPCDDTVNVQVNGLVCDFCARALEKVFGKRDDVHDIAVDLDKGSVVVTMKPGRVIEDSVLTQLITDSGYDITGINRGC